jgi:branched-chain amino acid transport system permease protein
MIDFVNYLISGALIGLLYSLIAMGFVVIYRASKVFNFAQGELVVFGGFVVWWLVVHLGHAAVRRVCRWPSCAPRRSAC